MYKIHFNFKKTIGVIFILAFCVNSFSANKGEKTGSPVIQFKDQTKQTNLDELLKGIHGHAVAWGDINNDGYPDLFVGTFAAHEGKTYEFRGHPAQPAPNKLFLNIKGKKFVEVTPSDTEVYGVCSGAAFADFNNDGHLDLIVSHISVNASEKPGNWVANDNISRSHKLYKNDGTGKLIDVTVGSGLIFNENNNIVTARNTFVFDYDGDGLLDILIQEDDLWQFSIGRSKLMRNKGDFVFEDVTEKAGLPLHFYGLGGFVGDINGDTWPDIFFAHVSEMYINNGNGTFRKLNQNFVEEKYKGTLDDRNHMWTCGADIGDLNGDGLMDFIMGEHYNRKDLPHQLFVFINKGNDEQGNPVFENVTKKVGIKTSPSKQPHVEIEDFNNDGKMDIITSSRDAFFYTNMGVDEHGLPQFEGPSPSNGPEGGLEYWAAAASTDYNRDGLLDFIGVQWKSEEVSPIFMNVTKNAKNYLTLKLDIAAEKNRNGIGAAIEIYQPGRLGVKEALIGKKIVSVSNGFNSGRTADVHFGTKGYKNVDVRIIMPCDGNVYKLLNIRTKQYLVLTEKEIQKYR